MTKIMRGKKIGLFLSLLLTVTCIFPVLVSAATAPDVARLLTIPGSFSARVAADSEGNIYVADSFRKSLRVYASNGDPLREIKLAYEPTALAVSPDDKLYVGGNNGNGKGSLNVLTPAGAKVMTIPAERPAGMAFLSGGGMYLLDGYVVRKLNAAMTQEAQFGGYATLPEPVAIAVNEQRGEIYVLDMGARATAGTHSNTPVWRVQVFDLAGTPLRNFSKYGLSAEGMVGSASGLAVDNAGRIYVSDNTQPIVVVFDENGVALKTIFDNANSLYNIVNISFSNDRLYLSSMLGAFVTVYGVDGYAQLSVAPASVDMTYQAGMASEKGLTISNTGPGALSWSAGADAAWLSIVPGSGQVAGNASQAVAAVIDPAKMPSGSYAGTISFQSNGGTATVPVRVRVSDPPVLTVSPANIVLKKVVGQPVNPVDLSIQIADDLSGARTWHAEVDPNAAAWLGITQTDGISNVVPAPQVLISEVPVGTYSGTITVTSEGATGSPAAVAVSLEVINSTTITVSTNLTEASFTINGPAKYNGTGNTSYTYNDAKPGTYTITFAPVKGYRTPSSRTAVLATGETLAFDGTYADLRNSVNIVASKAAGVNQPAELAIFTGDGVLAKRITNLPYKFGANTAVGDFDGDGNADIVAGTGGLSMPSIVKGMYSDGTPIPGLEFTAFLTKRGVNVAAADFDGDGIDEIIAGDKQNTFVKIYSYSRGAVANTGVHFEASARSLAGVNVAAADIDGDGRPELVTTPDRRDLSAAPTVNIYKVDTTAGTGKWKAVLESRFDACSGLSATSLAIGDVNGDGAQEILTVCSGSQGAEVRVFTAAGTLLKSIPTGSKTVEFIAAGDTTLDGAAEIILGDPAGSGKRSVRIMDAATGRITKTFDAFTRSSGVGVSVGNLGY